VLPAGVIGSRSLAIKEPLTLPLKRAKACYEPTREAAMAAFAKSWRRE
jgi:hypothetical protein